MTTISASTIDDSYTIKSLYEVIKLNLLSRDKDLMRFIRTSNNILVDEFKKIKGSHNILVSDIMSHHENYSITYMMIKNILRENKITNYNSKVREITDLFLKDVLNFTNKKSTNYSEDD